MIFNWLHRHLPSGLASVICGGIYAGMIVVIWYRWDTPSALFRYAGF